jgi:hypothetical protein
MASRERSTDDPRLQLEPASGRSHLWLWLLGAALPIVLGTVVSLLARTGSRSGSLLSSDWQVRLRAGLTLPDHLLGPLLVACIALVVCALLAWLMRRHRLRLDAAALDITTSFYHQRLPLSDLQLDAARVIAIDERPELKPMLKTNGMALPGFASGWFRSRAFKKLFVATAGGQRLLWLPTRRGFALLLQPRQPQALLDRLRELAADAATSERMTASARAR